MIVKKLVLSMLLVCAGGIALAGHCPVDMKEIDAALSANPQLSAEKLAEVKRLRAEGEALHKAGKHEESMATLGKAKAALGI